MKHSWVPTPTFLYRHYLYKKIARDFDKNMQFLDIGPGNGEFMKILLDLGFKGQAIDISSTALKFLQREIGNRKGIDIKKGDLFKYKHKSDLIFCFEVLEHIKNDQKALKKIYSLLKPGGHLVFSVPAHMSLWAEVDKMKGHFRRYEKKDLKSLLKDTGFKIDTFWCYGFPFLVLVRKISGSGRFIKKFNFSKSTAERTKESGIVLEYNPKLKFFVASHLIWYPLFKIMDLFLKTNWGLGYIVVVKK